MFMILQVGMPLLLLSEKSIENDGATSRYSRFHKGFLEIKKASIWHFK